MYVDQLSYRITALKNAVNNGDYTKALQECGDLARKSFAQNFMRGGTEHKAWPPRKSPLGSHPLLMLSLAMYHAVTVVSAPGNINVNTGREIHLGVDLTIVPYARAQNFGYPPRNLPMRQFMVLDAETTREIKAILAARQKVLIDEALKGP